MGSSPARRLYINHELYFYMNRGHVGIYWNSILQFYLHQFTPYIFMFGAAMTR